MSSSLEKGLCLYSFVGSDSRSHRCGNRRISLLLSCTEFFYDRNRHDALFCHRPRSILCTKVYPHIWIYHYSSHGTDRLSPHRERTLPIGTIIEKTSDIGIFPLQFFASFHEIWYARKYYSLCILCQYQKILISQTRHLRRQNPLLIYTLQSIVS